VLCSTGCMSASHLRLLVKACWQGQAALPVAAGAYGLSFCQLVSTCQLVTLCQLLLCLHRGKRPLWWLQVRTACHFVSWCHVCQLVLLCQLVRAC
jgi:hypothetical protein